MAVLKHPQFYTKKYEKYKDRIEERFNAEIERLAALSNLYLPTDIPVDDIQKFYEELGCPFFNSKTKKQILKLSKLQLEVYEIHRNHRKVIVIKSQKIGVSSVCIIIALIHALTDCVGMEIIINAQSDDQAKTHAEDLRRMITGSDKYRDYLITKNFQDMGLLKEEVTKVYKIYLHNPRMPRLPTKIIVTGQSQGSLLSHKRVGFIWSSDMTIASLTADRQKLVWGALMTRLANSQGPVIVECPMRAPEGPVFDTKEKFEKKISHEVYEYYDDFKKDPYYNRLSRMRSFYVQKMTWHRGVEDEFFDLAFIEAEKEDLGPAVFGMLYEADAFASQNTWYKPEHFARSSKNVTDLIMMLNNNRDDNDVSIEEN